MKCLYHIYHGQPHKRKNDMTKSVIFIIYFFSPPHRLFHEHIQRLSKVVTANHKALQIPEVVSIFFFKHIDNRHLFEILFCY